jgi:hypothetical protein
MAAPRDDHFIWLPKLPIATARQMVCSLLNAWTGGGDVRADRRCGLRLGYQRGQRGPDGAGNGPRVRPSREGETGTPDISAARTGLIAARTCAITGDTGAAVARPAPLVTDLAAYGCEQVQDSPEDASRGPRDAVTPRPLSSRLVPSQRPTARRLLASRHGGPRQAAQALLDAWLGTRARGISSSTR